MLVKPMNTSDLLRQIEALLVSHEDNKRNKAKGVARAVANGGKSSAKVSSKQAS
jgi:hypothetical protein